jgi:hypothetical protein
MIEKQRKEQSAAFELHKLKVEEEEKKQAEAAA